MAGLAALSIPPLPPRAGPQPWLHCLREAGSAGGQPGPGLRQGWLFALLSVATHLEHKRGVGRDLGRAARRTVGVFWLAGDVAHFPHLHGRYSNIPSLDDLPCRYRKQTDRDFPGGAVVKNPPANAGDTGSSPGPGRSHMPRSN